VAETLRLIVRPDTLPGKFIARFEGPDELIVQGSRQPLVDGARVLLGRGFDSGVPLTMRHAGKDYDSFHPLPIGKWASWTYEERERDGFRCARWMPRQLHAEGQKSRSEPEVAPEANLTGNRFYDGAPQDGECAP
jgi:hypothetical protein